MSDMRYKKSEDIARNAHLIGCTIDDVNRLDEYLAGLNHVYFTLFDVKSNTGIGDRAELLLKEYVKKRILREPRARYLCPEHEISLAIVNATEGKCIDCSDTHLLSDCDMEMVYERMEDPEEWASSDRSTVISPPAKREPPIWRDRSLRIGIILVVISAFLGWILGQLSCTNSAIDPPNVQVTTASQVISTKQFRNSHLPTVRPSSKPSVSSATTEMQKASNTPHP